MILENGVFLLSLKLVKEMPYMVNIGILLDLFVAVILLGMFLTRINNEFDEMHVDNLTNLKD
jgi:hydrogenase-4 component E